MKINRLAIIQKYIKNTINLYNSLYSKFSFLLNKVLYTFARGSTRVEMAKVRSTLDTL
jgi:hypothetical protein